MNTVSPSIGAMTFNVVLVHPACFAIVAIRAWVFGSRGPRHSGYGVAFEYRRFFSCNCTSIENQPVGLPRRVDSELARLVLAGKQRRQDVHQLHVPTRQEWVISLTAKLVKRIARRVAGSDSTRNGAGNRVLHLSGWRQDLSSKKARSHAKTTKPVGGRRRFGEPHCSRANAAAKLRVPQCCQTKRTMEQRSWEPYGSILRRSH